MSKAIESMSAQPSQNFLLGSRRIDFFLLGGFAVLLWLPMFLFGHTLSSVSIFGFSLPTLILILLYVASYPHFMASYKLAYSQGLPFITNHAFQLVAVPIIMLVLFVLAAIFWDVSITDSVAVHTLNSLFIKAGLLIRVGMYGGLGPELFAYFITFMFFTVGWHYSKQVFGCMMVYAKFDGYSLNNLQRNIIRYALLSTWWVNWLSNNSSAGSYEFYGLHVFRLNLPYAWYQVAEFITFLLFVAMLAIFIFKYFKQGVWPSWNFLIPMVALLIWHIPLFQDPQYLVIIGFFHALQYFPFVAKVELTRFQQRSTSNMFHKFVILIVILAAIQFLVMSWIPMALDFWLNTEEILNINVFMIVFVTFINIHHYFIDNVLWRFQNKEVRELLFN